LTPLTLAARKGKGGFADEKRTVAELSLSDPLY
jgi:hypothetical protein